MAGVNPTYKGNNFKEWFKSVYGEDYSEGASMSKGEMSDVDWDIGQALYKSYLAEQKAEKEYNGAKTTLEKAYGSAIESAKDQHRVSNARIDREYNSSDKALDERRNSAIAESNKTYELMKKYLPEQLKENGLASSGFSESTMLGAYSTHSNALSRIESDHSAAKNSLATEMAKEKAAIDSELNSYVRDTETKRNSELSELERAYLGKSGDRDIAVSDEISNIVKGYEDKQAKARDAVYADAKTAIAYQDFETEEELQEFIDEYSGKISSDQMTSLKQLGKAIMASNSKVEADALNAQERERALSEFETTYNTFMELGRYDLAELIVESNKDLLGSAYDTYKDSLKAHKTYTGEIDLLGGVSENYKKKLTSSLR